MADTVPQSECDGHLHFITIGEYCVPLVPGTPCLHHSKDVFVFPLMDAMYAVMLPDDCPQIFVDLFAKTMKKICTFKCGFEEQKKEEEVVSVEGESETTKAEREFEREIEQLGETGTEAGTLGMSQGELEKIEEEEEEKEGKEEEKREGKKEKVATIEEGEEKGKGEEEGTDHPDFQPSTNFISFARNYLYGNNLGGLMKAPPEQPEEQPDQQPETQLNSQGVLVPMVKEKDGELVVAVAPGTKETDDVVVWALRFLGGNIEEHGQTVADGIMSVGVFLSLSLLWGAWLMEQDVEQKNVKISPKLKKGIASLKKVTPHALCFTKGVRDTIMGCAEYAAVSTYHYFKPAEKEGKKEKSERKKAAYKFASQTVGTVLNVWDKLDAAGDRVMDTACHTSTRVVEVRYGEEAGDFMRDTMAVTDDIYKTVKTAKGLDPNKLGKKLAKHSGKTVVKTHIKEKKASALDENPPANAIEMEGEQVPENAIEMEGGEQPPANAIEMEKQETPAVSEAALGDNSEIL